MTSSRRELLDLYRYDLRAFQHFCFGEAFPRLTYHNPWHVDVICDALTRLSNGGKIIINAPPRSGKSLTVSSSWPLFCMAHNPGIVTATICGSAESAQALAAQQQQILASDRLRSIFPGLRIKRTGNGRVSFVNGSELICTHIARPQPARGADIIVVDEPLPLHDASLLEAHDAVADWFLNGPLQRNRASSCKFVIVTPRTGANDLCSLLTAQQQEWKCISIPALVKQETIWSLASGIQIHLAPLTSFFPEVYPVQSLRELLIEIKAHAFSSLYLQSPILPSNENYVYFNAATIPIFAHEADDPPPLGFIKRTRTRDLLSEHFGDPSIVDCSRWREPTDEEWEMSAIDQQRRLIASLS